MGFFDFYNFIYNNKRKFMKRIKQDKVKISITISRELLDIIDNNVDNRSNYIEHILLFYYNHLNKDVSKIKL